MDGPRILIVDDEISVVEAFRQRLMRILPNATLFPVYTEQEFLSQFPEIEAFLPDIVVLDILLPWTTPIPNMQPPPPPTEEVQKAGHLRAGIRCLGKLRNANATATVPVVLHSVISEMDLRESDLIDGLGEITFIVQKTDGLDHLINFIRSVTQSSLPERGTIASVFVVHGHDHGSKEMVARFLEHLPLKPVILHERRSGGVSIFRKFEKNADVAYAVVLLTPDAIGASKKDAENLRGRARQNVILELGYFLGKLGASKVCVLKKGELEIPSDYQGILYIETEEGEGWRSILEREIRGAGVPIQP